MAASSEEKGFISYVIELMQGIGPVSTKKMFGCYGVFLNGLMFGLVSNGVLYLKADAVTANDFRAKGLEMFTYHKKGKEIKMSYYQAPEEALEDVEEMLFWGNKAYNVALRTA